MSRFTLSPLSPLGCQKRRQICPFGYFWYIRIINISGSQSFWRHLQKKKCVDFVATHFSQSTSNSSIFGLVRGPVALEYQALLVNTLGASPWATQLVFKIPVFSLSFLGKIFLPIFMGVGVCVFHLVTFFYPTIPTIPNHHPQPSSPTIQGHGSSLGFR